MLCDNLSLLIHTKNLQQINIQDTLQVFQGSGIGKMDDNLASADPLEARKEAYTVLTLFCILPPTPSSTKIRGTKSQTKIGLNFHLHWNRCFLPVFDLLQDYLTAEYKKEKKRIRNHGLCRKYK